ncbi:acyltransferase family protein [Larkinella soli]|uniref:acyltransferase family protein n=1 Tax=Larkinella soli TaxID=1770527 RepID=UPI000FFC2C88|nr:acyltransferase [Larkinella soli]
MEKLYSDSVNHRNNFDLVRFLLALSVIFTHGFVIYYGKIDQEPLWRFSHQQLGVGTMALNFFFVISGFLVTKSFLVSRGGFDFLIKRALRIYPGFAVVCIAGALLFGPLGTTTLSRFTPDFLTYWKDTNVRYLIYSIAKLYPPVLPDTFQTLPCPNDVNTSIWTIWYEFLCYLLVLAVGLLGLFRKRFVPLAIFAVVAGLNLWHFRAYEAYNQEGIVVWETSLLDYDWMERLLNLEHFLYFFTAGICFYYYRNYIPKSRALVILSAVVLVVTLRWLKGFELAQGIFGSYLLFSFIFSKRFRFHRFAKYGDFSYGIYLYGWPVQQLVMLYFGDRLSLAGTIIVSMLLVFPFAVLSWHLVEKQFLKLKRLNIGAFFGRYEGRIVPVFDESVRQDNNFYFLRCLMITAVIFTHSYVIYYISSENPDEMEPLTAFSLGQITVGSPALNFFFVISGLLITQSWFYSKTWMDFVVRRILRVFPAYVMVSLACVYVIGPLGLRAFPSFAEVQEFWSKADLLSVLSSAFTLAYPPVPETFTSLPASNIVNASLWSVLYEVYYYLVIIFLGVLGLLGNKRFVVCLFLAVYFVNFLHKDIFEAYNMGDNYDYAWIPYFPPAYFEDLLQFEHYFLYFVAGVFFYTFRNYIPKSRVLLAISVVVMLLSIRWFRVFELTQPVFGTYILLYVAFSRKIRLSGMARHGDFTYGMYLYSWPIQQLVLLYFGHVLTNLGTFFVSMALIVPAAALSWNLIEKPFMNFKHKPAAVRRAVVKA